VPCIHLLLQAHSLCCLSMQAKHGGMIFCLAGAQNLICTQHVLDKGMACFSKVLRAWWVVLVTHTPYLESLHFRVAHLTSGVFVHLCAPFTALCHVHLQLFLSCACFMKFFKQTVCILWLSQ
jgi:hypothetical protein